MAKVGDRWISIREAAALVGDDMRPRRMLRRLRALHQQRPELGLLRRPGARWYEVSAEALQRALTTNPGLLDGELDHVRSDVRQATDRLTALRDRLARQAKRIDALEHEVAELRALVRGG